VRPQPQSNGPVVRTERLGSLAFGDHWRGVGGRTTQARWSDVVTFCYSILGKLFSGRHRLLTARVHLVRMRTTRQRSLLGAVVAALIVTSLITATGVSVASSAAADPVAQVTPGPLLLPTFNAGQQATPCWAFHIEYPGVENLSAFYSVGQSRFSMRPLGNAVAGMEPYNGQAWYCISLGDPGFTDPLTTTVTLTDASGQQVADVNVRMPSRRCPIRPRLCCRTRSKD
jgi:hypothetical protein